MIADVEDAFAAEKAPDLTNTVHSLKGALSNFFPRHLVSILQAIETRSHTEPPPQLRQDWVLAQTGIQSFLVDMRQALTELQTKRSAV
jgi:aryl-alcohol dehydrogenase-like predicted oxidoreductase